MHGKRELKSNGHSFNFTNLNGILIATIASILASIFMAYITQVRTVSIKQEQLIDAINHLCIGVSVDWVDSRLGYPKFISKVGELKECVYVGDYVVIRVFYNNEQCVGFFVTKTSNNKNDQVNLSDYYAKFSDYNPLGEFSYHDIYGTPALVYNFITNGSGHVAYIEKYYYAAKGVYYDFFFMSLDYGPSMKLAEETLEDGETTHLSLDEYMKNFYDDEVTEANYKGYAVELGLSNRFDVGPNTYGVCKWQYTDQIYDTVLSYNSFDFSSLNQVLTDETNATTHDK